MSIVSNEGTDFPQSTTSQDEPGEISNRKAAHLEICVAPQLYEVETSDAGFSSIRFLHRSLPEIDERDIDTRLRFLGSDLTMPVLISCMTGGSGEGTVINRQLAEAAQQVGVPVGMGSIRILFRDDSYFDQFYMKPLAPDVPVIANLSAVQVRDIDHSRITELLRRLEVQALAIHLNAGQELFQPHGDRDFRGLKEAIAQFCDDSPVPVIVKETGFGMRPSEIDFLLSSGVAYVDLAGAGGTNWARVESYRVSEAAARTARQFDDWGIPTAVLLAALRSRRGASGMGVRSAGKLISSGGVRTGVEVAKSLALGAELAGLALPFARAVHAGGVEAVLEEIAVIGQALRSVMALTGSVSLDELRSQNVTIEPPLAAAAAALLEADGSSTDTVNG